MFQYGMERAELPVRNEFDCGHSFRGRYDRDVQALFAGMQSIRHHNLTLYPTHQPLHFFTAFLKRLNYFDPGVAPLHACYQSHHPALTPTYAAQDHLRFTDYPLPFILEQQSLKRQSVRGDPVLNDYKCLHYFP